MQILLEVLRKSVRSHWRRPVVNLLAILLLLLFLLMDIGSLFTLLAITLIDNLCEEGLRVL